MIAPRVESLSLTSDGRIVSAGFCGDFWFCGDTDDWSGLGVAVRLVEIVHHLLGHLVAGLLVGAHGVLHGLLTGLHGLHRGLLGCLSSLRGVVVLSLSEVCEEKERKQ